MAGKLRPGNAGSNTTADHVEVLDAALAQLPVDPHEVEVVARADSGEAQPRLRRRLPGTGRALRHWL
ncbi:MAG: hypothetical protein ACRDYF_12520 [Acidimicrobiia bacterium]